MSFRFRKSFNLGFVRINISGSGIGWSWGIKGLRFGRDSKGRGFRSITIPGTGFSERSYSSYPKKEKKTKTGFSFILFFCSFITTFYMFRAYEHKFEISTVQELNFILKIYLLISLVFGISRVLFKTTKMETKVKDNHFRDAA